MAIGELIGQTHVPASPNIGEAGGREKHRSWMEARPLVRAFSKARRQIMGSTANVRRMQHIISNTFFAHTSDRIVSMSLSGDYR